MNSEGNRRHLLASQYLRRALDIDSENYLTLFKSALLLQETADYDQVIEIKYFSIICDKG